MSDQKCTQVLQVVAAVLHLGNVRFARGMRKRSSLSLIDSSSSKEGGCEVCNIDALETAATLLGVSHKLLAVGLTMLRRAIPRRGSAVAMEITHTPLSVSQAEENRNALAKDIYNRIFAWLIQTVCNGVLEPAGEKEAFVGLLDIFGEITT